MHELPRDLTNSLRSFRGSIYGGRVSDQYDDDVDLEKGEVSPVSLTGNSLLRSRKELDNARDEQYHQEQPFLNADHEKTDWATFGDQPEQQQQQLRPATNTSRKIVVLKDVPPQTPATTKESIFHAPQVADPDPAAARFQDDLTPLSRDHFFELIGMAPPTNRLADPRHLAIKHGLYSKIVTTMQSAQWKYRVFDGVAYALLAVQLILSALFIVLGVLPNVGSRTTIAVLGAIATFVTGSLALMKGQGLPNRLRQTRDAMRNVAFAAEELYMDFQADRPVLFRDVSKIREDYLRVVEEARRNHPDTWTPAAEAISTGKHSKTTRVR